VFDVLVVAAVIGLYFAVVVAVVVHADIHLG
jgi:hypothetical protein